MKKNYLKSAIIIILGFIVFTSQSHADPIITSQPISFNKGVSFNDIFLTSKFIEILKKEKIPFYVSNEGTIYVEEKNENIINFNNPTEGLRLIQFPELSNATLYIALLSAKGIGFVTSKSGDNKYFNIYYRKEDSEKIYNEVRPLYLEAVSSGVLVNIKEN